jgi:hypothetical protein
MTHTKDEALKLALEAAYLAGFNASGEGWNGEYPFGDYSQQPEQDKNWYAERDNFIKQALAAPVQCSTEQEPVSQYYDTQFSEQERKVIAARGLEPLVFNRIVPPVQRTEQESVQEPVAWPCEIEEADFEQDTITLKMLTSEYVVRAGKHWLSTTPPAAQRKPLTDEQRKAIVKKWCAGDGVVSEMIDLIEAAHGIKGNT